MTSSRTSDRWVASKQHAMNIARLAISVFVLAVIALVAVGWLWTGQHQAPAQATASHIVLGIAAAAGAIALVTIWRSHPSNGGSLEK